MSDKVDLDARIVRARKQYKCWACNDPIVVGQVHVAYPGKNDVGKFLTTRLCIICSFLMSQKTGQRASSIRQGEFAEPMIPNLLRKKRREFLADPKKAVVAAGLDKDRPSAPPVLRQQVVVKASELSRRIFRFPESRYRAVQFAKGAVLTLRAGVNGRARDVRIVGSWSTSGEAFGCRKRQVAILVK